MFAEAAQHHDLSPHRRTPHAATAVLSILCGQVLSTQYFSRTSASQHPHKLLIAEILSRSI
jgi:hypothetical protein